MDLVALRYLSEAARFGSITKAAAELRVAQSALSRQIRLLEEELGIKLLVRYRRGVKPTKNGMRFLRGAETLLQQAAQLRSETISSNEEPVGSIRLGFLPATSDLLIAPLVADFINEFPKVTFFLQEGYTRELAESLIANRLDLAVMTYEFKHQDLQRTPLFTENMWAAALPSRWPFSDAPVKAEQLADLPLVHSNFAADYLAHMPNRARSRLRSVIVGDTRSAIRAVVRTGIGVMIMPVSAILAEITSGELRGAPIEGFEVHRALFQRLDVPNSRALIEFRRRIETAVDALIRDRSPVFRPFYLPSKSRRNSRLRPAAAGTPSRRARRVLAHA